MPVSLVLIGVVHVSRTGKLSPVALMMTNEVPLGTKGARAPLMRNSKPRLAEQSQFRLGTILIDKLCAQHKAFFMPVSLALI